MKFLNRSTKAGLNLLRPLFLVLFVQLLLCGKVSAQSGTSMYDAFPIAVNPCGSTNYYDYQNNGYGFWDNFGNPNPDIWYSFTVGSPSSVSISLCGSDFDTYLFIVDEWGNYIASNDDSGPGCASSASSLLEELPAGNYFIVVEGSGYNTGNVSLAFNSQVLGSSSGAGNGIWNAIDAGVFNASGSYMDSRDNSCMGNFMGQLSGEIYYKFTVNGASDVVVSHCGSGFDTYMYILDVYGNVYSYNDDNYSSPCPGTQAYIAASLPAGTYYVVSEGYGSATGNISTSIAITMQGGGSSLLSYSTPNVFSVGSAVSLVPVNSGAPNGGSPGATTTFAGTGSVGASDGAGPLSSFSNPLGVASDASGNIYIADAGNHKIRKISASGVVSTFAGSGSPGYADGTGTAAYFQHPSALAVDASGNVFVSDQQNHRIRKITPSGVVTTFAGNGSAGSANGTGTGASFSSPIGLVFDGSGNLYVCDYSNNKIRKITPSGVVSNFAGTGSQGMSNGTTLSATFNRPMGIAMDNAGNFFIADRLNHAVRKISSSGNVTTLAGNGAAGFYNGTGSGASFNEVNSIAVDANGTVYVADRMNNMVRAITSSGSVTTLAGSSASGYVDGTATVARFTSPYGICIDGQGNLYLAENGTNRIRKISTSGSGAYTISQALPSGLVFNTSTGVISGVPSSPMTPTSYTVSVNNIQGSSSATFTIEITDNGGVSNSNMNWVASKTYDQDGNVVSEDKTFFDKVGRLLQSQIKNQSTGQVLATQPIYDAFGRKAISTLAAPINSSGFSYRSQFVSNAAGGRYGSTDFDGAKTYSPDPVGNGVIGTLGWYYSNNNTSEAYVAATGYPYVRTSFYNDGASLVKNSSGVGESLKMGAGHELSSGVVPVVNELDLYEALRQRFFPESVVGNRGALKSNALQSVTTDQNGTSVLTVSDLSGRPLMTARPDLNGILTVSNVATITALEKEYVFSLSMAGLIMGGNDPNAGGLGGGPLSFDISSRYSVSVYKNGSLYYSGIGNDFDYGGISLHGGSYTIRSAYPFSISHDQGCNDCPARISESELSSLHYFQLLQPANVNITGNYELYDMKSESLVSPGLLPAGRYKVRALNGNVTVSYSNKLSDISLLFYDQLGQVVASIAPEGVKAIIANGMTAYATVTDIPFVERSEYDLQSHVTALNTTDGGRTEYIYRSDGKIRFSQDAEQRKTGRFSYVNYDAFERVFESGEYLPGDVSFAGARNSTALLDDVSPGGGLSGGNRQYQSFIHFDLPDQSHGLPSYVQDEGFLKSTVSWTESGDQKTWYNYDEKGQVSWLVRKVNGLGVKTINYTYDARGNVTVVDYQRDSPAERFVHHYEYDADSRLANTFTSLNGVNKLLQSKNYYYLHGPLKRIELGDNLQGIDYTYTADGKLKAINHPEGANDPGRDGIQNGFATDAFAMTLEYFNGDFSRTGTGINSLDAGTGKTYYDGTIVAQSWRSTKPNAVVSAYGTAVNNPAMFTYQYDDHYQLDNNKYGAPNFGSNTFVEQVNANREHGLSYDANGNIKTMNRNNLAGAQTSLNYHYQSNTNKLQSVDNYASYSYDDLGQVTGQQRINGQAYYLTYTVSGKVAGIYTDASKTQLRVSFGYDENDLRIRKTDHLQNVTTYYLNDANGNVLAIYDNNGTSIQQKEVPIYAGDRLGSFNRQNNNYQYELNDNLGNVRVVVNRDKNNLGQADVVYSSDYYPYGTQMSLANNDYRYGYQGQHAELDRETGWANFDLRMYDSQIGRWLSTDPKGQHPSPYLGMGNNPISAVDVDGGEADHWIKGKNGIYSYDARVKSAADVVKLYGKDSGYEYAGATVLDFNYMGIGAHFFGKMDGSNGMYGSNGNLLISSLPEVQVTATRISKATTSVPTSASDDAYNQRYVSIVGAQGYKPYVWGATGDASFDCSGIVIYGMIKTTGKKVDRLNADGIYRNYTVNTTKKDRGTLVFYDYTNDGKMDHVTSILDPNRMLHPSSGKKTMQMQIKPLDYLDSYTKKTNGKIYFRAINWNKIVH